MPTILKNRRERRHNLSQKLKHLLNASQTSLIANVSLITNKMLTQTKKKARISSLRYLSQLSLRKKLS